MNSISNIWNHPKTSITGLLIATLTIAGSSRTGNQPGPRRLRNRAHTGQAVATALLGLLAKDPGSRFNGRQLLREAGRMALITLLLPLPFSTGCSGVTVAQDIVNWTPACKARSHCRLNCRSACAVDAPIFTAATIGFDVASNLLVTQARPIWPIRLRVFWPRSRPRS